VKSRAAISDSPRAKSAASGSAAEGSRDADLDPVPDPGATACSTPATGDEASARGECVPCDDSENDSDAATDRGLASPPTTSRAPAGGTSSAYSSDWGLSFFFFFFFFLFCEFAILF
jgi:hypothetical protein